MRIAALIAALVLLGAATSAGESTAGASQPREALDQVCEESAVRPFTQLAQAERNCIPREQCCKVCSKGKACGNSCIRSDYTCRKGRGCACDAHEICR